MSVIAGGTVLMKMKKKVPDKLLKFYTDEFHLYSTGLEYEIEFDGNIRLDDVIDELELLNPYIESGDITYWSDEGNAKAHFSPNTEMWVEEWQESYYFSELPDCDITATGRVKEILNIIADDLMSLSDSESAIELLFNKCKLSAKETRLYGLEWLADFQVTEGETLSDYR